MPSPRVIRSLPIAVITGVAALTGCGSGGQADAVWRLAPGQVLTEDTTELTALVSRLACNSGVTGDVNDPRIDEGDDEVTITFTVSPEDPQAAECPSNDDVPYEVQLSTPLAGRTLVDGACASTDAGDLTFCDPDATRSPS